MKTANAATKSTSLNFSATPQIDGHLDTRARVRAEVIYMPSLAEPIHPRACNCGECRRTYGPRN